MDESRPGYYAIIPASVRYDKRVPPNAKLLYGEISALIGADGYCFASNSYFMKIYGLSDPTVTRLITKLEDAGYIMRELEKDQLGQVVRRKIYLSVSLPEIQPPINFDTTSPQNCGDGAIKNDGYTNTSNTVYIGEESTKSKRHTPLTNKQLYELVIPWINNISGEDWPRETKVALFTALDGFYAPRAVKKQEPARTEAAFKALTNRLVRYSDGSASVMIDMLERATTSGWKSVFPLSGDKPAARRQQTPAVRRDEEWL